MQIAIIGLGRMGGNIARRLMAHGHECLVYDRNAEAVSGLAGDGAKGASSLGDLAGLFSGRRVFWVMLPAGEPTEATIRELSGLASPGDVVIDGGNSFYKDDIRRSKELERRASPTSMSARPAASGGWSAATA